MPNLGDVNALGKSPDMLPPIRARRLFEELAPRRLDSYSVRSRCGCKSFSGAVEAG